MLLGDDCELFFLLLGKGVDLRGVRLPERLDLFLVLLFRRGKLGEDLILFASGLLALGLLRIQLFRLFLLERVDLPALFEGERFEF